MIVASSLIIVGCSSLETHSLKSAVQIPADKINGVWAWNRLENLQKTTEYSIKTVYLQRHNDFLDYTFRQDMQHLKNNYTVWLLDGNNTSIDDLSFLTYNISILEGAKQENLILQGLHLDIEPYTRSDYTPQSMTKIWNRYLQTLTIVARELHAKGFKLSVAIPFWLDSININNRPLCDQVIDLADEVIIMAYRTEPNEFLQTATHELAYADIAHKDIYLGIELASTLNKNASKISFFGQHDKLKAILTLDIPYHSFRGFVFHSLNEL